ncbi:methyl-accepting chemotaxis protein [Oceanospirillum sediminis]|uniref:Methyl-accepting chemotaxis protein n=1 Tax=Oceanospirillum sediminis TaxID=2760088 RepID=A0A839IND6_9GAMM|nr:methyl-accepting chemotaxis protein [Oceanospirillum sediminis]MBB1486210.1 methyl-accepting chemotaxis protein [Oceanospirillum sediminis]
MDTLLNRFSTRAKVMGNALLLIILMVIMSVTALFAMKNIGDELETIAHQDIPLTEKLTLLTEHQLEQAIHFERGMRYGLLLTQGQPASAADYQSFTEQRQLFDQSGNHIEKNLKDAALLAESTLNGTYLPEDKQEFRMVLKKLAEIKQEHHDFEAMAYQVFDLMEKGKTAERALTARVFQNENMLDQHLKQLLAEIEQFTHAAAERALEHEREAFMVQLVSVLLAICIGVLTSWLISHNVICRLAVTASEMKKVSEGDLTVDICVDGDDEIGKLQRSMKQMQQALLEIIRKTSQIGSLLSSAAEEVSMAMSEASRNIQTQQQRTDSLATAMNQMSIAVHDVVRDVSHTSQFSQKADRQAQQGHNVMTEAMARLKALSEQITDNSRVVSELEENSNKITSVLEVIRSIADQTNLLALNAAIEAARAGESGRGFSVVADEVRVLATRTQESTEEIRTIIEQLQHGSNRVVEAMQKSCQQTDAVVQQSDQAGMALAAITETVSDISRMGNQIAGATEEQSQVINDMSTNVSDLNQLAHQNAACLEETTQAGAELARMAEELKQMMSWFRT